MVGNKKKHKLALSYPAMFKQNKNIFPCLFLGVYAVLFPYPSTAGNDGFVFGPRGLGTGQSGLLHTDIWANHNNIGALGWLKKSGAGVSFDNRYNLKSFNQIALTSALVSKKYGVVGIGVSRFGSELFSQSKASLGWAKSFGMTSIGLQGQWYQVAADEFPTRHYLILNFGGLAKLTSKVHFAASIQNLNQAKASDFQSDKIPTIVRAGLSFLPNTKVKLISEIQKDLDKKSIFKIGIEYEVLRKVWARTGFSSQIQQVSGGVGFEWNQFQFDYAIANHPQLGWTNSIGINFIFGKSQSDQKETSKGENDKENK